MDLRQKKILVTGADGFLGSHLTEELLRCGYSVRAFVFYNSFNSRGWLDYLSTDMEKNLEVFTGDIRDPHGVETAMKGCQVVIHLAALVAIPYSYHSPDTYVDTNIRGTLNILQAARNLETEKIVHTSTSEVYGSARYVPMDEDHPLQGQSPYSATKIAADQLALSFYRSFDTPVTVIRPFNTYGPRQSARAVIPAIITQIAAGHQQIRLGAAHPTRDFNYISDTVRGFVAAAECDQAVGEIINIGTGYEIAIEQLVKVISEIMQADVRILTDTQRLRPSKSEVLRLCADSRKAKKILGWEPRYAGPEGLRQGLSKTVQWFSNMNVMRNYKPHIYNI